jgi:predicted DNA binding CopG/RHH family protein
MNDKIEMDAWETGELGRSEEHVKVAAPAVCKEVDDSLGLQLVSIRLQKSLIANLKMIAGHHGLAYQPMIRDLLNRFAVSEMKNIVCELVREAERQQKDAGGDVRPVSEFLERERKRA